MFRFSWKGILFRVAMAVVGIAIALIVNYVDGVRPKTLSGVTDDGLGWTYHGTTRGGRPHGTGRMDWRDGAWYDGEWKRGDFEGNGTYREYDNVEGYWDWWTYTGEFRDGLMNGYGRLEFDDGEFFTGYWENGEFIR